MIRLVIADDHAVVLKGLESLLTLEPDLAVLATCTDGEATLEAVRKHHPDILLLDLLMPRLDGLGVLRALKTERKPPRDADQQDHHANRNIFILPHHSLTLLESLPRKQF